MNTAPINKESTDNKLVNPTDFDIKYDKIIDFYRYTKQTLRINLICICLFFLAIPLVIYSISSFIWGIKAMSLKYKPLKAKAITLGIMGILFASGIGATIMFYTMKKHFRINNVDSQSFDY